MSEQGYQEVTMSEGGYQEVTKSEGVYRVRGRLPSPREVKKFKEG